MSETYPTTAPNPPAKPPLSVDRVLSTSIRAAIRHFWLILLIYGVTTIVFGVFITVVLGGTAFSVSLDSPGAQGVGALAGLAGALVGGAIFTIPTLMVLRLGYDGYMRQAIPLRDAFRTALKSVPAVIVLAVLCWLAITLGFLMVIVPGVWLFGVLSCVPSSIMIEGRGMASVQRSIELTKGYRWQIVGTWTIMIVIVTIASLLAFIPLALVAAILGGAGIFGVIVGLAVQLLTTAVQGALIWTLPGVIHARLVDIKEGTSSITDVFD